MLKNEQPMFSSRSFYSFRDLKSCLSVVWDSCLVYLCVCVGVQFFQQHLLKRKLSILQCTFLLLCSSHLCPMLLDHCAELDSWVSKILDFFFILVLYPANLFIIFNSFLIAEYLGFSTYKIISSSNSDCFTSFFPI